MNLSYDCSTTQNEMPSRRFKAAVIMEFPYVKLSGLTYVDQEEN